MLSALGEKHYLTKTRGERNLPFSRCLGTGKFLLIDHNKHTHFIYQLTSPSKIKEIQQEFNLKQTDDYLISVKNPQVESPTSSGLGENEKAHYPPSLQEKFANHRFIPLNSTDFLDYQGAELLLISLGEKKLVERTKEVDVCLEKISSDHLLSEFTKIAPPSALAHIEE